MEAVVLFDYEKQQDDEVNLIIGEVVTDVIIADEGWCEGTVNGNRGLFPDNFVQIRPASGGKPPASAPAPAPAPMGATTNDLGAPPLRDMKNKSRRAKVSFSYAAENTDELTLLPGQTIDVIAEEEEGWWRGRSDDGKEGLFPSNFVEELGSDSHDGGARAEVIENIPREEKPVAPEPARQSVLGLKLPAFNPAAAKANLRKTGPPAPKQEEKKIIPSLPQHPKAPEKPPEKPVERAKVTFDYVAEQADELSIKVGDVVEVLRKDQEGWWEVRLGESAGMIPDNFVEVLPAQQTYSTPRRPPAPSEAKPEAPPPSRPEAPPPSKPAPPPSKEPLSSKLSAFKKPTEPKRPHPPPSAVDGDEKTADFGVPTTAPLDSSAVKNRPKKSEDNIARPHDEPPPPQPQPAGQDSSKLSPWQEEVQKRRSGKGPVPRPAPKTARPPPPGPKAAVRPPAPELDTKPRTASTSGKPLFTVKPPPTAKPELKAPPPSKPAEMVRPPPPKPAEAKVPPHAKPEVKVPPPAKPEVKVPPPAKPEVKFPPPAKPAEVKVESHSPAHHPPHPQPFQHPPVPPTSVPAATEQSGGEEGGAWKEAIEQLRADFEKFKEDCLRDIQGLTDDLDKERKARAMLEIDIDRLKKVREHR